MLDIGRRTAKDGQRIAAAGIVAALAAPSSLILGSDWLMGLAIFGFCVCVVVGYRPDSDVVALAGTALASAVCLICVPAAEGIMSHALAFAFSCGCIALASMARPFDRAVADAPADDSVEAA